MTDFPKPAALAVVIRNNQVLLVKRRNEPDAGLWGFPGGHVDLGETAMDAAARELREETGVVGHPVCYLTNVDVIERDDRGAVRFHFLLAAMLCDYFSGEPIAQDDVSETGWWAIEDVLNSKAVCSAHVDKVVELADEHRKRTLWATNRTAGNSPVSAIQKLCSEGPERARSNESCISHECPVFKPWLEMFQSQS